MPGPHWNQGLCTEALSLVIGHCRELGTVTLLFGEHFTDNPASRRVLEKCGFTDTRKRRKCTSLLIGADKEVKVLRLGLQKTEKTVNKEMDS